jgi:hypothetical protein
MQNEISGFGDKAVATLQANVAIPEKMGIEGYWRAECRDSQGNLKWVEEFPNLVVAAGKELMLNTLLRTSGTYTTVGPFLGLTKVSLTPVATDTMTTLVTTNAAEFTNYTVSGSAVRGTAVFAASTSSGSTPSNITSRASRICWRTSEIIVLKGGLSDSSSSSKYSLETILRKIAAYMSGKKSLKSVASCAVLGRLSCIMSITL